MIQFNAGDLVWLLPEIILFVTASVVVLMSVIVRPQARPGLAALAVIGALAAGWAAYGLRDGNVELFSRMVIVDPFATYFRYLFVLAVLGGVLLSVRTLETEGGNRSEYYGLMLFAAIGMMVMAEAGDLLMVYIGLELMSLSLYVLAGFYRRETRSNEAAIKYFILGTLASGVFVYGLSLLYGLTGTTSIRAIGEAVAAGGLSRPALVLAVAMVGTAFAFKVSAVPFHMWTPDVYEGAPTPVTAFMSVGPKAAGFAVFLRVFLEAFPAAQPDWNNFAIVLSILTMAVGNVIAIAQTSVKRMLAYSSIGHAGYILIGLVGGTAAGAGAVLFYLLMYTITNLGAFGILVVLQREKGRVETLDDFAGLGKTHPAAALGMLVFLFSLTGIPPMAGFFGKFYLFTAAVNAGYVWLAVLGVLMSAVSAFYYLRVVLAMYMQEPVGIGGGAGEPMPQPRAVLAVTIAAFLTVGIGILLNPLLSLAAASLPKM